jgi:uncharacterized protein YbaR (Trm112 family)
VFIELTDHLRCPRDHPEAYLVLLPDEVVERGVRSGQLGCPVCGATFPVSDGVAELDAVPPLPATVSTLAADAIHAFLGLSGPGGYALLVGGSAAAWRELSELNPGVALVALNPPDTVRDAPPVLSVVRAARIPLKARSMRGVVLGTSLGDDPHWVHEAARVVLPGLRVAGHGAPPDAAELELLGHAGGWWVAARR